MARGAVAPERWEAPTLPRFGHRIPVHLNQGKTSACTGFSMAHALRGQPAPHVHYSGQTLYKLARENDQWKGNEKVDEGSSVRGAAKGAQRVGEALAYRWLYTAKDLKKALRWIGVVVVGTDWHQSMFEADKKTGLVKVVGPVDGGHAYAIAAYDDDRLGGTFTIWNSWGTTAWGLKGVGYIGYDDMDKLMRRDGEGVVPMKFLTPEERGHGEGTGEE